MFFPAVGRLKRPSGCDVFVERDIDRASSLMTMLPASAQVIIGDVMQLIAPERVPADAVVYCDPPYLISAPQLAAALPLRAHQRSGTHALFLEWARRAIQRTDPGGHRDRDGLVQFP